MTARLKIKELDSPEWLRQKYWEEELTTKTIGTLLGCSRAVVQRRMREHNVPTRSGSQASTLAQGYAQYKNREWLWEHYVEKELSTYQIAGRLGCGYQTVCRWLEELDIPRRDWVAHFRYENRDPSWNDKFFDELTPDGAYIIGFIIADGYLRGIDTERYAIQIVQKDRGILDKISSIVGGGSFHLMSNAWGFHFNSKHAYEVLTNKFGLPSGGQKSYTVRIPKCILEREDLLPHCIRGIFDGDGGVNKRGTSFNFTSGSLGLLNDIARVLTRLVSLSEMEPRWISGGYIKKDGERSGAYLISYNLVLDTIDFAKLIYGPVLDVYGSTLYLERKRERFARSYTRWNGGRKWLVEKLNGGATPKQIADILGVKAQFVSRQLKNLGEDFIPCWHDRDWLFQRFVVEGKSVGRIAVMAQVESNTICHWIKHHNLQAARFKYWNLELGI